MRNLTTILLFSLAALLCACEQQHTTPAVDPELGLDCFASHRASLQPGTQYEGIENATEDRITIRIMNGVEVVTLDCKLGPGGSIDDAGKQ